ncbi:MAG TPA: serine hydrolase [Saprospiraceae bacterium]|nr:serine hydrolase [Saprospiraceae bacterium]
MKKKILMLMLSCGIFISAIAQQESTLAASFDKIINEELALNGAGATVLVGRHGEIIYNKAFGLANVELNVPMKTDNVFRIGSITKQFTAIAILQLMEQGKLNLQDEITRFIPDYPMQGAKITIEHLLTHTSGIRDYTSLRDTVQRGKIDFTPEAMIDYFKNQPMRFEPGDRYEYSNSNYFLLGYIIEKITGNTYQQYLVKNIFKPLDMHDSYVGKDTMIIKNRAAGYSMGGVQIENAAILSMTHPYAAGAILSTTKDLFKWNEAVQSYKLVKKETLEKALTRYKLNNGKEINYGYGFRLGFIQESPSIWHGGRINGFITTAMCLTHEEVFVVILSNCDCNDVDRVSAKLAALAIGKPYDYKEIEVPNSILQRYAGVYENEAGDPFVISVENGQLFAQRGRNPRTLVKALTPNKFFFDDPMIMMEFHESMERQVDQLIIRSRSGNESWNKTDKLALIDNTIQVDEEILEMYTGEYEMTPQFAFTITREKQQLFLQATDQDKLEMFAETENKFFLKVNDARFEFVNESGRITKVIMRQGGRTAEAMKIK